MENLHKPLEDLPEFRAVAAQEAAEFCKRSVAFVLAADMCATPVVVNKDVVTIAATAEEELLPCPLRLLMTKMCRRHTKGLLSNTNLLLQSITQT